VGRDEAPDRAARGPPDDTIGAVGYVHGDRILPARGSSFQRAATPLALQVALLIPILVGLVGLLNSFRMMRLPDPPPSSAVERMAVG
jgi:hypothetical protein